MLNSELMIFLAIGSVIFLTVFSEISSETDVLAVTFGCSVFFSTGLALRSGANIKNFFF
jgi:hypothetical protein